MAIDFARGRGRGAGLVASWFGAAALAVVSTARAQTASAEDIASARALGTEGVRLAESGDCQSAIPKLEGAEKLYHAPTTLEKLGECLVNVGRLVAGTEALNRVVRESLPPTAPAVFATAQQRAAQVLATAQPRIGKLRIHVEGAPVDQLTVTVDGAGVPSALLDAARPTDPGTHEVKATAAGYKAASANVDLAPGAESTVSLKLEPDATAAATAGNGGATQATQTSTSGTPPAQASGGSGRLPAFVAFGVGGVGLVVGAVSGVMALGSKSTLDNACSNKVCPASSQSDIDALSTRATIANVGFAVGVAGAGVGAILLLVGHGSEPRPQSAAAPRHPRWSPWLGVGAAGVGGTFE